MMGYLQGDKAMSKPLKRVAYLSRSTRPMTRGELTDMLAGARLRNQAFGVTGILVHDSGHFLQVLEGPVPAIEQLLHNIRSDPRHRDYELLSEGPIKDRYFPKWSMDWSDLADMGEASHGQHATLRSYLRSTPITDRATIYRALVVFIEGHLKKGRSKKDA